jgi:hypothetical protein
MAPALPSDRSQTMSGSMPRTYEARMSAVGPLREATVTGT